MNIELYNVDAHLKGLTDKKILKEIDYALSYQIQGFQFMSTNKNWDGRYRLFSKSGKFPIGMLSSVEYILNKNNVAYSIIDRRPKITNKEIPFRPGTYFKPRYYQIDAMNAAVNAGSGVIQACTGSGKTLLIAMILAKYNCKTVVYVIGTDLLYQMKNTIEEALGIECGIVGDGHCDIKNITIATIWSAATAFGQKADYIENDFDAGSEKSIKDSNKEDIRNMVKSAELLFLDECQYAGSSSCRLLHVESVSARHRFLLSGTPWRDTGDDILIEAMAGPKIFEISASELIEKKFLVQPFIHFVDIPNKRNIGSTYQEVYNNYIVENEERNNKIVDIAKQLVNAKRKVLILIVRKNHGKILQSMLESDLTVASLDGNNKTEDRIAAINGMKSGEIDVLIASKIFDQGVDIPELDALILAGSGKSSGRALQRIGRVIRTGPSEKKDAIVIDFYDDCKYLKEHSRARYKIYSREDRFKIKLSKGRKRL